METILVQLGIRLREIRTSKGVSQQRLASLIDTDKSRISRIENGQTNPSYITLIKISQALRIEMKDLIELGEIAGF